MSLPNAELETIAAAYRQGRTRGLDDFAGFAAALDAYLAKHPTKDRAEGAREVNRALARLTPIAEMKRAG